MTAFVKFWGTRGSIPTPGHRTRRYGGNTSCVTVRFDDVLFICDGGTGLRELGVELAAKSESIEAHLFFSHTHWDHIQGFPFFMPAYSPKSRLNVYDTGQENERIKRLLMGQMRSEYFPVTFTDLGSRIVSRNIDSAGSAVEGVTIRYLEQNHPGRSFAFSFQKGDTKIVYATDSELDLELCDPGAVAQDPTALRRLPERFVEFARDATLLIADAQYTDEEYKKHAGWGHARAFTVTDFAIQSGAERCALFHHDPMQSDHHVDQKVFDCTSRAARLGSTVEIFAAREGLELKL